MHVVFVALSSVYGEKVFQARTPGAHELYPVFLSDLEITALKGFNDGRNASGALAAMRYCEPLSERDHGPGEFL